MMTSPIENRNQLMQSMLPGLGFFGTTWADRLQLDVFSRITDLVVSNPAGKELELKGVRFLFGENSADIPHTVTTGGDEVEENASFDLVKHSHIQATGTEAPFWWVHFESPALVRRLQIFNQGGWMNASMTVVATREDGTFLTLRDPSGVRDQAMVIATIAKFAREDGVWITPGSLEEARQWRTDRVAELCATLRAGAPRPSMDEALRLTSLLPIQGGTDLTDDDYFLMAYLLMAQAARNEVTRSGWGAYRKMLPGRSHLRAMATHFDEAATLLDIPPRSLTRHGLVQVSKLSDETEGIGTLAVHLRHDLAKWGLTPLIAYGSLLGYVREGHLLAHDDDFDSMVCVAADSPEAFDAERAVVVDKLRGEGWDVKLNGKYWNVHVSRPGDPAHIDMFFVHVQNGRANTHMERMTVRDVPAEWLEPGNVVNVDGIEMAIPREPERFLEDRYGSGWTEADLYADWPWTLDD